MPTILHDHRTGLRDLDASNEVLCYLIDRVFDPMVECRRAKGSCDHSKCTKIGAILKFTQRNFAVHESLMSETAYPLSAEHALDHARLVQGLEAMQAAYVCGDRDRNMVRDFVVRWTRRHVHSCDRPLGDWAHVRRTPLKQSA